MKKIRILAALLLCAALLLPSCTGGAGDVTESAGTTAEPTDNTATGEPTGEPTGAPTETPTEASTEPGPAVIAGHPLADYSIVYRANADPEEERKIALLLSAEAESAAGCALPVVKDIEGSKARQTEIVVGTIPRDAFSVSAAEGLGTYDYLVEERGGRLYLAGGSSFALRRAVLLLCGDYLARGGVPAGLRLTGNVYGELLFPPTEGSDLRLMSNNVWACDSNKWQYIGGDSSSDERSIGLAAVYMAYQPDVICFQEMTAKMILLLQKRLADCPVPYSLLTYTDAATSAATCMLYRSDRLSLIAQGHHDFTYANNGNTKSYTWGYFEMKESGKHFIALSTHLWWKSETAEPGSDQYRLRQATEICDAAKSLTEQYGCPLFAMGDFNCNTDSAAFRYCLSNGFADTFDIASGFRDNNKGYHSCSETGYARETSALPYKSNAIDHIILTNPLSTEVLTFDHARPYFYITLSDHYPVYVDVKLGN